MSPIETRPVTNPKVVDRRPDADELERPRWLPHERWPFALRRYRHRRAEQTIDIHYTDEGQGPVLVFIHAGMWSFIWRDVIDRLSGDFRCISLDFPGAGLSGGQSDAVDLATFPAMVNGLLDHCRIDTVTLVLHDLGGVVGVRAAMQAPDRVEGIVAANTFAWPSDGFALRAMLAVMGSSTTTAVMGTLRIVPRLTRTRFGVGRNLGRADRRSFFGPYRRRAMARNFHRAMKVMGRSPDLFVEAEWALTTVLQRRPVLTIFGRNNDPFGFAKRWKAIFPAAESWVVPSGNHFPMCDDPDGFADHLRRWHHANVSQPPG